MIKSVTFHHLLLVLIKFLKYIFCYLNNFKGVIQCYIHFYKLLELKCVLAVCTQPPYNDKNPPSVFFLSTKIFFPFSNEPISLWRHTDGGPSHNCWLTESYQHRLHWWLTWDPPWVSCHQLFHRRSKCRQEWLLSVWDWFLLLDVIMNIAVFIYSRHLSRWRGLRLILKGTRPRST